MDEPTVQISVDLLGQLKLFRCNTFADPYVFLTEAVQNAQRALATELGIEIQADYISFSDNGSGLSDPASLFTIAKTGWSEEVAANQEPFGLGFFSAIALADSIVIESGKYQWVLDYNKIVRSGNLTVDTYELPEARTGFYVKLMDLFGSYSAWDAKNRMRKICSTVPTLRTTINGTLIETYNPIVPKQQHQVRVVDNISKVHGWLGISDYEWNSDVKLYFQDRFVKNLDLPGIIGAISVGPGVVNLRAPDRRDLIRDELYDKFMDKLKKKAIHPLIMEELIAGTIGKYQLQTVDRYVPPEVYARSLTYTKLKNVALDKAQAYSDNQLADMSFEEVQELLGDNDTVSVTSSDLSFGAMYDIPKEAFAIENQDQVPIALSEQDDLDFEALKLAKKDDKSLFYAEPIDLKKYRDLINAVLAAGKTVIVARTRLEARALKDVLGAVYIGQSDVEEIETVKVKYFEHTDRSRRVVALVEALQQLLGTTYPVALGKVDKKLQMKLGGSAIDTVVAEPGFILSEDRLVINANELSGSRVLGIKDDRVDLGELLFVIGHLSDLADALEFSVDTLSKKIASLPVNWIVTNKVSIQKDPEFYP